MQVDNRPRQFFSLGKGTRNTRSSMKSNSNTKGVFSPPVHSHLLMRKVYDICLGKIKSYEVSSDISEDMMTVLQANKLIVEVPVQNMARLRYHSVDYRGLIMHSEALKLCKLQNPSKSGFSVFRIIDEYN